MDNRKALYILIAALILAALTGRWMTDGPSLPSADSADETYFHMQRIAFTMTLGTLVVLILNWQSSGQFPKPVYLAIALLIYFVCSGTPQTQKANEWARGNVGIFDWFGTNPIEGISGEVAQRISGVWKSGTRTYTIKHDALTVDAAGEIEKLDKTTCPSDASYFRFGYATEDVFQFNPVAEPYFKLLREPPVPLFEASCSGVLYTFLLRRDNTLVAFKNLHRRSAVVEILARVP